MVLAGMAIRQLVEEERAARPGAAHRSAKDHCVHAVHLARIRGG